MVQMQKFIHSNLGLSERGYYSLSGMKKHCPDAKCFIAGSDQIWRTTNAARFLTYASEDSIKLAYAASIGNAKLSENMKTIITPWLKRLDGISIREKTAVEIVNSMVGNRTEQVIDPTLLLDYEEYPYEDIKKRNYIYCYFLNLNDRKNVCFDTIKSYAKETKKELYITAPINYPLFQKEALVFPSVEQWLGYYKNAECIFTNTFHGMLFCIIFKKQFLFFVQNGQSSVENDRFYSLMSMLHLENRMVTPSDSIDFKKKMEEVIDYEQVYSIIQQERLKSDDFFSRYGI